MALTCWLRAIQVYVKRRLHRRRGNRPLFLLACPSIAHEKTWRALEYGCSTSAVVLETRMGQKDSERVPGNLERSWEIVPLEIAS